MIPSLFSEASISAIDFTGISSPPCTNKWRSSLVFSTISTPTIPPLYVYNLVFGRSWETNGVGKQHWWDWGRFENIRAEALTWLVSLNNNLTGSVGKRNIAKGWIKAGISELVQGKTILSPEDPFENIEAILIEKPTGSAIELNSASVGFSSVLLKDVMLLTLLNISASCLVRFYSVIVI